MELFYAPRVLAPSKAFVLAPVSKRSDIMASLSDIRDATVTINHFAPINNVPGITTKNLST